RSAAEVLAGLPGGDPLAAALAAGETPSPQVVAEGGEVGTLSPGRAALLVGLLVVTIVLVAFLDDRRALIRRVPPPAPPDELDRKARLLLADLGYPERPADSASYFVPENEYLGHVARTDPSPHRWDGLRTGRPAAVTFFYRESPEPLAPGLPEDPQGMPRPV